MEVAYGKPAWMDKKPVFNINTPEFLAYVEEIKTDLDLAKQEIRELKNTIQNLQEVKKNKGEK